MSKSAITINVCQFDPDTGEQVYGSNYVRFDINAEKCSYINGLKADSPSAKDGSEVIITFKLLGLLYTKDNVESCANYPTLIALRLKNGQQTSAIAVQQEAHATASTVEAVSQPPVASGKEYGYDPNSGIEVELMTDSKSGNRFYYDAADNCTKWYPQDGKIIVK